MCAFLAAPAAQRLPAGDARRAKIGVVGVVIAVIAEQRRVAGTVTGADHGALHKLPAVIAVVTVCAAWGSALPLVHAVVSSIELQHFACSARGGLPPSARGGAHHGCTLPGTLHIRGGTSVDVCKVLSVTAAPKRLISRFGNDHSASRCEHAGGDGACVHVRCIVGWRAISSGQARMSMHHQQQAACSSAAMAVTETSNQRCPRGRLRFLCSPGERAISASRPHANSSWRAIGDTSPMVCT
jgi:hypothetical protein